MKYYVEVRNGAERIPTTITAPDGDTAAAYVAARFPGCKIAYVAPATKWDVTERGMLEMARDLDAPKAKAA